MDMYASHKNVEMRKNPSMFKSVSVARSKETVEDQLEMILSENSIYFGAQNEKDKYTPKDTNSPARHSKLNLYKFHST